MTIGQQLHKGLLATTYSDFHFCFRNFAITFGVKSMTFHSVSSARMCSPFGAGQYKVKSLEPREISLRFRIHANGSYYTIPFQTQLRCGTPYFREPINTLSYGLINSGFGFCSPYRCAFAQRTLSPAPRAIKSKHVACKYWTQSKTMSDNKPLEIGEKKSSESNKCALKDEMLISKDQPVDDVKIKANLGVASSPLTDDGQLPKAKGKMKTQSKSNKNQAKSPAIAAASDEAAPQAGPKAASQTGSEKLSQSKKQKSSMTDQLPPTSEVGSKGKSPIEVVDCSSLEDEQSRGATNTISKRKSTILAKSSVESGELLEMTVDLPPKLKNRKSVNTKQLYPPNGKSVLVVESVTKAKIIQEYLGDMFEVLPSYGHVRDLAAKSGSVRPEDDFSMVWEVPSAAWNHLKSIKSALAETENLILASDPDREGEAIAWHIIEMLQQQNVLHEGINVVRVVFNEITEASIKSALQTPRDIDFNLVHAYLARRALDYLIGFNISPLLWRKLPGCQSAGRVQSAALALICDRELEIEQFKPQEYWTIEGEFKKEKGSPSNFSCPSNLTHFNSKKLSQLSITSHTEANDIENMINASKFEVIVSSKKKFKNSPPPPYITSTLQQDAADRLHFSSSYTMKLAQKLYEGVKLSDDKSAGLITYMRTDGLHMSDGAVKEIHSLVTEMYGHNFISNNARKYFKKVKNAQEAHEAIRPTDVRRLPSMLARILDEDCLKLYTLIWARSIACQMEPSITEQIQVDIGIDDGSIIFRTASSRKEFFGYQAVYNDVETRTIRHNEDKEDGHNGDFEILKNLESGDPMDLGKIELKQHHTQPPPRYSEGTLVKKMEELGIGRPSTYASTIKVLKDRNYISVKSRVLHPEFRGRMVSAFLSHHFFEITDYSFTADMETELDNVSGGLTDWKGLLKDYWTRFSKYCERASNVHIHQVEKMLEKTFGDFLFASLPDQSRTCPSCSEGSLIFKVSRFGAGYFIGCDQHPKCKYIAKTFYGDYDDDASSENNRDVEEPKVLGLHPGSNEKILLKDGPYGQYVQLGEDHKGYLPKRASVSQIADVSSITLEDALHLLSYPITLGKHPDDGQPVVLKLARHGLSVKHRRTQAPVPKNMKPDDITLEKALKFLKGKDAKQSGRPKKNREKEILEVL